MESLGIGGWEIVNGLFFGMVFGFLLQRAHVLRYDKQIGALLLRDMTIVKFLMTAILVGGTGVFLLVSLNQVELPVRIVVLGPVIIGGLVYGLGWGILGYCPGTQAGALGEGRWDAGWGILGTLAAVLVFNFIYPLLKTTVYQWGNLGDYHLHANWGANPWLIIGVLVVAMVGLFAWFEKKGL